MSIFVVAGATGHIGSVVARELLAQGHQVRALVRNADKARSLAEKGAELVIGELDTPDVLAGALRGADGAFLLQPPPPFDTPDVRAYQDRIVEAEAAAVTSSGIRHVVQLSSWGADRTSGTGPVFGLHVLEAALQKTGAVVSMLRAGSFTENLLNVLHPARQGGVMPNFLPPDRPYSNIATRDIAAVAVRELLAPPARSEVVYVVGAHEYSPVDHAAYLSKKLGKEIKLLNLPPSGVSAAMQQAGMGAPLANSFQEMYEGLNAGLCAVAPGHRVEKGPTTLEQALDPYFAAGTAS